MKISLHLATKVKSGLFTILSGLLILDSCLALAENHKFSDSWGKSGYTVESQSNSKIIINYSVNEFTLTEMSINGVSYQNLELPGHFLPNEAGAPNLPGSGRYIAIPHGATATMKIVSYRSETLNNVNLAPSFRIPWDTETGPLEYSKNESIYSANRFFPEEPIVLSEKDKIRGIDVVMLGITPFHYNPVTRQLIVYRDLKVEVSFDGGTGHFGDDRLRSRWWDPMLSDLLLNYSSLPKMDYNKSYQATDETGCEYLIITPTATVFQQWADSIRKFRTTQGIYTNVITLDGIGGNTASAIENYINNAYNTWDIVPAACLLLGDYGTNATNRIISPLWDNYCVSDNVFADVNNNNLPDIIFARITAQDEIELQVMVSKFLDYERMPPTNANFYAYPVTSLGWETESWFQICSEAIGGYWSEILGKTPIRINEIYSGTPGTVWSTAPNTSTVVNYFGPAPSGLGYIPAQPTELGGWTGGTAAMITTAINNGTFMVQHRDHGFEEGWEQPAYTNTSINALTNTNLSFVWSINSLTGKFNHPSIVFAEKLHRYSHKDENGGCVGINAATEVIYSFVSDVYVWGAYDYMWTDFLPDYGSSPLPRGILPAFACAAGKYFLQQSTWPANANNKDATYHLFHHHGDAFSSIYSEVPQNLTVSHSDFLYMGNTTFEVTADIGALIALSVNGELIGTGTGTGGPVVITIPVQAPPDQVLVTVTKQNYFRYQGYVDVLPATGPYVVFNGIAINDAAGNGNGIMETSESILASITLKNVGVENASNVFITISSTDPYITITDNTENYGPILAGATALVPNGFAWNVSNNIPDLHNVAFVLTATDGTLTWNSNFYVLGHAPSLSAGILLIDDYIGNFNQRLDPGETAYLIIPTYNNGSYLANNTIGSISCSSGYITLNNTSFNFYEIGAGLMEEAMFSVTVSANAPAGTYVEFLYQVTSGGYALQQVYPTILSMVVEDWETGDMSQFNWTTGGNSNWTISTDNPYQGSYCIKSGPLTHDQSNFLTVQYEVYGEDSLSFWYKVSSETGYDFLKFYIDDVEISSWSGEVGWERASFMVSVGLHTFKWTYSKDQSLTSGFDCAWLDFIVFPVAVYEASFTSSQTEICEGGTVSFYDQSPTNTISWNWIFEGGTPGTSTLQNPVITYPAIGIYDVSLAISNGTETNTLVMENYITVSALPGTAPAPTGPTMVCGSEGNSNYSTTGLTGITTYNWLLEPSEAGFVTGTGLTTTVYWTSGFLGEATLKVAGENICGTGAYSDPVSITRYLPEVTLEPFDWVCVGWPSFELTGGMPVGGEYSGPGVVNGWFDPTVAGTGTHTITYTYSDANGCENFASESIVVDPCTGFNEMSDRSGIKIYPNPTAGMITIGFAHETTNIEILVMNTLNKMVYSQTAEILKDKSMNIDLSFLVKGIYFIKFKTADKEEIFKIIIQ
jgi:PKD repeat protein